MLTPYQGNGADRVYIDEATKTIHVLEVKSSQSGISSAASAEGNPAAKLEQWSRKSARGEPGWGTQNPANIELAETIREALKSGKYQVKGIQAQIGVPMQGTTDIPKIKFNIWK